MGNSKILNSKKIIAIVGSRNCSEYGRKYATIFAHELAKNGVCIISGMAVGIDAAAHFGAIKEIGHTIAVLGGGLKNIYPQENLWLYNNILSNDGCVITEYEENEETKISNFPKRNRIISGIADAVLVIEAEKRSGSRITAKYAKQQNKKIYCIPLNLDQKNSSGIRELVNEGARTVTSASQLINDLYFEKDNIEKLISKKSNKNISIKKEEYDSKEIPEKFQGIYRVLEREMNLEEISNMLDKSIEEIDYLLTIMEVDGYIEKTKGSNFKRKS